jgi:sulfide:quinone oxidoreductase
LVARVLILGGGFGGIAAAHRLRELRPDDEVILVERGTHFAMGFRKNAELSGQGTLEEGRRPIEALARHGIQVRRGEVSRVDPAGLGAEVDGERIEADAMVVALGAARAMDAVPGLGEHAVDAYDPAAVPGATATLWGLDRARVAIGIFGVPYTCPPAPYELALLLREEADDRSAAIELSVFTPQPMSLPVLGTAGCEVVEGRLGLRGIGFRANAKAERVEAGRVVLVDRDEIPFDLLLAIPPHRCPAVLVEAGLAEKGGWATPDPATLATSFEHVYAIGDCVQIPLATGQPLPKAGVLAEAEGRVVAERIAAGFEGREAEARFAGEGTCWLEVGGGEAMVVRGRFLAEGGPQVELSPASPQNLEEKAAYERERLDTWFGPA